MQRREALGVDRFSGGDGLRQCVGEHCINLDCDDAAYDGQQSERQRSETRADLEDDVARVKIGGADDAPHRVGVDDEVLPTRL